MIMIDTHVVVWLATDESRISHKARISITEARRAGESLAVSSATLLELAALARKGRINAPLGILRFLEDIERRFTVLQITAHAAAQTVQLPASFPGDPIDRIIAATAIVEGTALVTADAAIRNSRAVPTIW
jgi:PIN domain nuclease of toxin-antitoxin system